MRVPTWFQTPRQLTLLFLVVALASTGALAGLTLELLTQEQSAAQQRQRERLEQAADAAVVNSARSLRELERYLDISNAQPMLPAGTILVAWAGNRFEVLPRDGILYRPVAETVATVPNQAFVEAEQLELKSGELAAAVPAYTAFAASTHDRAVQAAAWARIARVYRKLGSPENALDAYARLEKFRDVIVDGLPAALIARVGRASVFEGVGDTANARIEARQLEADLRSGILPLTQPQHAYYAAEASRWLGASIVFDSDAVARTEAAEWIWTRRTAVTQRGHQVVVAPAGAALISWKIQDDGSGGTALIVGPRALNALAHDSVPSGISWALTDSDGRLVAGQPPPSRAASRTPAVTDLPWTLHVFSAPGHTPLEASARRTLLLVITSVGALLIAGWYFMWRGISRELRVARLQSDFVAAVSHEFRSPLTSLRQIAELLQGDRFASEDQKRRSYDLLASEADRLGRLVEGLLDFARFEERGMEMRPTNVSLDELVGSVVTAFDSQPNVRDRLLSFSPSKLGIEVKADRDALTRAVWNVVDNAVKYSPVGGNIRVSVDRGHHPGTACVSVADEGIGIPAEEQRAIFDRFVRGSEAKSLRINGTGIGLALVRTIVRAHNGDIAVKSAPGAGSTFTLTLPAVHVHDTHEVRSSAADFVDVAGDQQVTR